MPTNKNMAPSGISSASVSGMKSAMGAFTRPMLTMIDSVAWLGAFLIIGAVVGWMGR